MMEFETMSDAFDYCREAGKPIRAIVKGDIWKLYPSGKAENLSRPDKPSPIK
jgi:hypothetical protein